MVVLISRGTTPTHVFTLPVKCSVLSKIRIIYSQGGKCICKKDIDAADCEENKVSCKLTQEDTLQLDCSKHCDIQLRALTQAGDAFACDVIKVSVGRCLDDEVLA